MSSARECGWRRGGLTRRDFLGVGSPLPQRPAGAVHDRLTRRDFVSVGSLTAIGLGLSGWFRGRQLAAAEDAAPKARACILVWLDGGPSHLETFDLKPDAPSEVRGPFRPISTAVPGIHVCELLPRTASRMADVAIVRSVTSPLGEHNLGAHYLLTGYKPTAAIEYPALGAVVAALRGGGQVLPNHIAIPNFQVGGGKFSGRGFLPESTQPFSVGGDPAKPDFRVQDLEPYPTVDVARLGRRREFLQAFDRFRRQQESVAGSLGDEPFEQAFRLLTSAAARSAFDLSQERAEVRQRYGNRTIGQSCLLARRLVERGVSFVTVNNAGWDTHENAYTRLKEGYTGAQVPVGLIPSLDVALSALLEDLQERGLLQQTLVVVMGEFGRTPKINTAGGRDHWPRVFSVALAGGGIRGGQVLGASDPVGEGPKDHPVTPADLACTIYTLLGIDPRQLLHSPDGRPIAVNGDGNVLSELIG